MYIEYDDDVDCAFLWFVSNIEERKHELSREIWPEDLRGEVGILVGKGNQLLGIEVLSASKYLDSNLLRYKQE